MYVPQTDFWKKKIKNQFIFTNYTTRKRLNTRLYEPIIFE